MPSLVMPDQRQHRRRPVSFLLNKYVDGVPHLVRAVNLSRGGMLLHKVGEPEPRVGKDGRDDRDGRDGRPGDFPGQVELEFIVPESQVVVRLRGQVLTEVGARAHAVRFLDVPSEIQPLIDAALAAPEMHLDDVARTRTKAR